MTYLEELGTGWCVAGFTHYAPRAAVVYLPLPHMVPLSAPLCQACADAVHDGGSNLSGLVIGTHLTLGPCSLSQIDYDADKVQP